MAAARARDRVRDARGREREEAGAPLARSSGSCSENRSMPSEESVRRAAERVADYTRRRKLRESKKESLSFAGRWVAGLKGLAQLKRSILCREGLLSTWKVLLLYLMSKHSSSTCGGLRSCVRALLFS